MHLAERNMWRIMAKVLWGFNISLDKDASGNPIEIDTHAYNPGILQAPLPFKAVITPRSEAHVATIKREYGEVAVLLAQFE
jgi:hypothetical protein